jgi:uncharacterized protein (TIGR02147 family)
MYFYNKQQNVMKKPDVFKFTDYRKYLLKVYRQNRRWGILGYRGFSKLLGFSSWSEIYDIINDGRNLSLARMVSIIKKFKMTRKEAEYFELLVHLGTAKGTEARRYYLERVLRFRKSH